MAKDIATKNLGTVHEKRRVERVDIHVSRHPETGAETLRARFYFESFTVDSNGAEVTPRASAGETAIAGTEIEKIKDWPAVWAEMQSLADQKLDSLIG